MLSHYNTEHQNTETLKSRLKTINRSAVDRVSDPHLRFDVFVRRHYVLRTVYYYYYHYYSLLIILLLLYSLLILLYLDSRGLKTRIKNNAGIVEQSLVLMIDGNERFVD